MGVKTVVLCSETDEDTLYDRIFSSRSLHYNSQLLLYYYYCKSQAVVSFIASNKDRSLIWN